MMLSATCVGDASPARPSEMPLLAGSDDTSRDSPEVQQPKRCRSFWQEAVVLLATVSMPLNLHPHPHPHPHLLFILTLKDMELLICNAAGI